MSYRIELLLNHSFLAKELSNIKQYIDAAEPIAPRETKLDVLNGFEKLCFSVTQKITQEIVEKLKYSIDQPDRKELLKSSAEQVQKLNARRNLFMNLVLASIEERVPTARDYKIIEIRKEFTIVGYNPQFIPPTDKLDCDEAFENSLPLADSLDANAFTGDIAFEMCLCNHNEPHGYFFNNHDWLCGKITSREDANDYVEEWFGKGFINKEQKKILEEQIGNIPEEDLS